VTGTYVALLRGINVGGRNKLPMRDLVAIFVDSGCSEVTNAYFDAKLGTTSTARNWRTVLKLHELLGVLPA